MHLSTKPPPNRIIMAVHWNMEDRGHGPLHFHAPTKESSTYTCWSPKVLTTTNFSSKRRFKLRGGNE
jgi:hypothetical protein